MSAIAVALMALIGLAAPAADEGDLREAARLRGVALAAMEEGNHGRAEEHLRRLAEILPDNVLPPINLAITYYQLGRLDAAEAEIDRARRLDPENPRLLYTLARILEHRAGERWEAVVEKLAEVLPGDPRPAYLRALRAEQAKDWNAAVAHLERALRQDSENLVLLVDLLAAAASAGDLEATEDALNLVEDRLNGFEDGLEDLAERLRDDLAEEHTAAIRPPAAMIRNVLRPGELYQQGLLRLIGSRQAGGGLFPQLDFDPPLPKRIQGGQDIELTWVDATAAVGLSVRSDAPPAVVAIGGEKPVEALWVVESGRVAEADLAEGRMRSRGLGEASGALFVAFDIDQDENVDLAILEGVGVGLYPGTGESIGGRRTVWAPSGPADEDADAGATGLFPLDVDHDGDLDLLMTRARGDLYLQNDGGGGWSERSAELGLSTTPGTVSSHEIASADLDEDGDLDLVLARRGAPPRVMLNPRRGPFREVDAGLASAEGERVAIADFDNDGRFDLLLWGEQGGGLWRNEGGTFARRELPVPSAAPWRAAVVADFDNDADADVLAVIGERVEMLRNRRDDGFEVEPTGLDGRGVDALVVGDFDGDGDLDTVAWSASSGGALRFWRNQGGDRNGWVRLVLRGKNDNNAKNNTQGLFTRIEARIDDGLRVALGNGGVNHLGLGARRQADVVRVVWTNGLAQTWQQIASGMTLVERQVLKGSCPFLYTWNGDRFVFVTDLMWKSPLGMTFADGSPAPHQSARDFVLVPGEMLRPAGDALWLQVTEELWETAYVDRQVLFAVDHPAEIDLVVDERFTPPPHSRQAPLHWLGRRALPAAARDHNGFDVLDQIRARDGVHVDRLPLDRYQGLTHGHALELEFAGVSHGESLRLMLWGWIFPTDTSINFALAQDATREPFPPRLELRRANGDWRTVRPSIGVPNGKRKGIVLDLGPLAATDLPGGRLTLRLTTNLQIYWDAAVLALGEPPVEPGVTRLEPVAADLHYRGFSRLYRESSTGPHLFDYDDVDLKPRFRDLAGAYTRFGAVGELLAAEDDLSVVMNAGDEMTVRFDASALPPLAPGWRRDWVLYTDGWVKDGDLHTAFSQTVEPLPYHGMKAYPDRPEHRYPEGSQQRDYRRRYQTRQVDDGPFRDALREPSVGPPSDD